MGVKNRIRAGDGDQRHGTIGGYTNHYCRCDACTTAIREYVAAWAARRRAHVRGRGEDELPRVKDGRVDRGAA